MMGSLEELRREVDWLKSLLGAPADNVNGECVCVCVCV